MAGKKGMHKETYMRPESVERIRERIRNSQIADRVIRHALGDLEMSPSQVRAAEILLRKVMPDLASQELTDNRSSWADLIKSIANQRDKQTRPEPEPSLVVDATVSGLH